MSDNTIIKDYKDNMLLNLLASDVLIICDATEINNGYVLGSSFMNFLSHKFTILVNLCSNTHYSPIRGYSIIKDEESFKIYNYFSNRYENNDFCESDYYEILKRLQAMKTINVIKYCISSAQISIYYNKSIYKSVLRKNLDAKYTPKPTGLYLEKTLTDESLLVESSFDLNSIIHNIMSMSNEYCEMEKRELYTSIVKLMASDGKFKENFMQIEDFDDKILLLEIYKDIFDK